MFNIEANRAERRELEAGITVAYERLVKARTDGVTQIEEFQEARMNRFLDDYKDLLRVMCGFAPAEEARVQQPNN